MGIEKEREKSGGLRGEKKKIMGSEGAVRRGAGKTQRHCGYVSCQ